MEIENYPSNVPQKHQEKPEKKVDKVTSGTTKKTKKSGFKKFVDAFLNPEDIINAKDYIIYDVIIPGTKNMILNSIESFFGVRGARNFFDDDGGRRTRTRNFAYNKVSENGQSSRRQKRATYDYDDIVLERRVDAEAILERMDELIETYGIVSIADYYDLAGEQGTFTDNKYGWTDIRQARVESCRDGWVIRFPKALPLD